MLELSLTCSRGPKYMSGDSLAVVSLSLCQILIPSVSRTTLERPSHLLCQIHSGHESEFPREYTESGTGRDPSCHGV